MIKRFAVGFAALMTFALGAAQASPNVSGPVTATPFPTHANVPASMSALPSLPEPSHALAAQDIETFSDGLIPYAIARGNIAGAVFVVVKDGQILFAKGYGYSDVAKRKPVLADQTMFRPGSVSKTFTWTAVMQLVQAGKIDLDRDVNDYLDFKIPPKFGKPITMRNLMTHTAGFEDGFDKSFVKTAADLIPLRDYVMNYMPARIYPPGKVVAYSNYSASLAGYIVQRLSGEPYADYIADHIFKPLGMNHSTMLQPLPKSLMPFMATGYRTASDEKPMPFEFVETAPAGALSASGTDMAHFMIAQLQEGTYNGASILSPATVALMHSPQSRMAPGVNGFDLGFYQENRNGLRIIGHAGDTEFFHSDLHLLLDKNVGVFMSFNSAGTEGEAEKVRVALFRAFLDRYFTYTPPKETTVSNPQRDAARVAGWYDSSRRIASSLRLLFAVGQSQVTARPDGTIEIDALKAINLSGTVKRWREVGPLDYREVGGQTHTKFVTDANGDVSYWISDDFLPVFVFQRVNGLEQLSLLKVIAGVAVSTLLLTVLIWFGGWIARRRFKIAFEISPLAWRLRLASRIGVLLLLAMLGGWIGMFASLSDPGGGITTLLGWLYVAGVLAALGAVAIVVESVSRILRGPGGWLVRCGEFVLGLSAFYAIWAICVFGLANFNFTY
jgi:CubicO group peptidase (beta-lactamase class C family)